MPGEVGPLGYHAASLIADGVPILISWGGVMVVGQQFTFSLYKLLPYTRPAAALGVPQPTLTRIQNRERKYFLCKGCFWHLCPSHRKSESGSHAWSRLQNFQRTLGYTRSVWDELRNNCNNCKWAHTNHIDQLQFLPGSKISGGLLFQIAAPRPPALTSDFDPTAYDEVRYDLGMRFSGQLSHFWLTIVPRRSGHTIAWDEEWYSEVPAKLSSTCFCGLWPRCFDSAAGFPWRRKWEWAMAHR